MELDAAISLLHKYYSGIAATQRKGPIAHLSAALATLQHLCPADAFGFESNAFSNFGAPPPESKGHSRANNGPSSAQSPASFDAFGTAPQSSTTAPPAQPQASGDEWDLFFTDK